MEHATILQHDYNLLKQDIARLKAEVELWKIGQSNLRARLTKRIVILDDLLLEKNDEIAALKKRLAN